MNEGISVADALALRNTDNGNNSNWGGDGWWIILLILLFAGGGWNRNGGFGGGYGSDGGYSACCAPATAQGVTDAFNFNQLDNGIRGLERGMCDGFYSTANGLNAVTAAVTDCCCKTQFNMSQGFGGIEKALLQGDFHVQNGFNAIGNQLASCCCDLGRGQENIKFEVAKVANDLLIANDKNTDRILNYLNEVEMDKLRTELQSAQFQLSQLSQTSNIVNQLMPVAKPAYITCSPYAAAFGFGNVGCGHNGGCGCC